MAEFLVNNEVVNGVMDHFKPYAYSCNYCSIKFDAIFDVGTLHEDLSQIAQGLQIEVCRYSMELYFLRPTKYSEFRLIGIGFCSRKNPH